MKYGQFGEQPRLDHHRTCVGSEFLSFSAVPDTALVTGTASVCMGSVGTPGAGPMSGDHGTCRWPRCSDIFESFNSAQKWINIVHYLGFKGFQFRAFPLFFENTFLGW